MSCLSGATPQVPGPEIVLIRSIAAVDVCPFILSIYFPQGIVGSPWGKNTGA